MPMCSDSVSPETESRSASEAIAAYLDQVESDESVRSMHLWGTGAIAELEGRLAVLFGRRHGLCVTNATLGLLAVLQSLDVRDSEVIASPVSWGGSVAGALLLGNKILFADIDRDTLGIDPESVRSRITPRTKAILATDVLGVPVDSGALRKVADEAGIWLIVDSAQSIGAKRHGLPPGTGAHAIVTSFTAGKAMMAGEGGAVLTDDDDLYALLVWNTQHPARQRRELGLSLDNEFALNGRMHPLAAVWALARWDLAAHSLREQRRRCGRVIELLNQHDATRRIEYCDQRVEASSPRLSAAWSGRVREAELDAFLERARSAASIEAFPYRLVYQQPAFLRRHMATSWPECPTAEREIDLRFCLRLR